MLANPYRNRITILMLGCLGIAAGVMVRAALLQVSPDPRLENMARKQFQSKVLIRPRRGAIVDRNGEPLAINTEIKSLAANPSKVQNPKMLARLLAKATDVPYARILQRLEEKREFVWIKRHLPEADLLKLRKWHVMDHEGDLANGLWLVKESQRVYPHRELAAHILGDVNLDSEGLEGIELKLNDRMRGKVVSVSAVRDALGRPTFMDAVAARHVQEGETVSLTIDASLQFSVEEELRNAVRKANARSGSVLVMNAVNGEILAMANEPSFNPNEKGAPADHRRNRLLTDGYEPGSTLKAVLAASALSHGWKLSDVVWGERGSFTVQGKRISEAEAHEKFEWVSVKKMLQVSSNVAAAKIALKLGADHYYNTLQAFGFGSRTETGFPGEIGGRVPARKSWQPLALANIGFGQGILATRMQMARAYAAFLNGGWLVQPRLIRTPEDVVATEAPKRVLSEKVADQIVQSLETVTNEGGTGVKAALPGYRVAGKTGTAQMVEPGTGRYSRSKHIASFIGFAVGVDPKFVILTTIDEPRGIYYASETAAPLFREVLNAVAARFSLPANPQLLQKSLAQLPPQRKPAAAQLAAAADTVSVSQARAVAAPDPAGTAEGGPLQWTGTSDSGAALWTMPSLIGLTAREAIRALQGHQFEIEVHGTGIVQSQFPAEGKAVSEEGHIRLNLSEP